MVIETRLLRILPGVAALTIWPFIFVKPDLRNLDEILLHEGEHLRQQFIWALACCLVGWPVGAIFWYWLYLVGLPFGLPFGWNPFRYYVEFRAFQVQGFTPVRIRETLRERPYYLWLHR